jgi:hypothetical protein
MNQDEAVSDRKEEKTERQVAAFTQISPRANDLKVFLSVLNIVKGLQSRLIGIEQLNGMLQTLLQSGACNEPITMQTTLLHILVAMGDSYLPLIKSLVAAGVRFDLKDGVGETAFSIAQRTKNTDEILAFFSQSVLQNQDMRSSRMGKTQSFFESSSSSSASSSSASVVSAPQMVVEVPSAVAQQVSSAQESMVQHKRTESNSFLRPTLDLSELQIPVTGRTEPVIQEEKQQSVADEDDMSIYNLSQENNVQSPQAQKKIELSLDMSCLHASQKKNPEPTRTPNNSAVEPGKSAATTPSAINHDIGAAFPTVPSDRSTTSNCMGTSVSQRSDISSDSQRVMPIAPPNSAKTPSVSGPHSEHRRVVSAGCTKPVDDQRSKTVSPSRHAGVDLLTFVADRIRLNTQSPVHARLAQGLIVEEKSQSDEHKEETSSLEPVGSVLPNMIQPVPVVGIAALEFEAANSPLPKSAPQSAVVSQRERQEHENMRENNSTVTVLGLQERGQYNQSPAVTRDNLPQEQNHVQTALGQWTGNLVAVQTKLPWYKRFLCCCCGKSQ